MAKEEVKSDRLTALDEYRFLGASGLKVSPLCLGTMTFGQDWDIGSGNMNARKFLIFIAQKEETSMILPTYTKMEVVKKC